MWYVCWYMVGVGKCWYVVGLGRTKRNNRIRFVCMPELQTTSNWIPMYMHYVSWLFYLVRCLNVYIPAWGYCTWHHHNITPFCFRLAFVEADKPSSNVLHDLRRFMVLFPGLVSNEMFNLMAEKLPVLSSTSLLKQTSVKYQIMIRCDVQHMKCSLRVEGSNESYFRTWTFGNQCRSHCQEMSISLHDFIFLLHSIFYNFIYLLHFL